MAGRPRDAARYWRKVDSRRNWLRIGTEERTIKPGDIAVIPGGLEHEAFFPEDIEVIDFFAPVREDFLSGEAPSYMVQR
jgi:hypothetical protein